MTMTGHQNAASVIAGLSALFNIVGNAILIPMYGIEGAAVATGVTIAVKNVVMLIYVLRRVGVNPTIFQLSFIKNQT